MLMGENKVVSCNNKKILLTRVLQKLLGIMQLLYIEAPPLYNTILLQLSSRLHLPQQD